MPKTNPATPVIAVATVLTAPAFAGLPVSSTMGAALVTDGRETEGRETEGREKFCDAREKLCRTTRHTVTAIAAKATESAKAIGSPNDEMRESLTGSTATAGPPSRLSTMPPPRGTTIQDEAALDEATKGTGERMVEYVQVVLWKCVACVRKQESKRNSSLWSE